MATTIRPELSKRNKYHIRKHRYYELKHFCLQYRDWKREYEALSETMVESPKIDYIPKDERRPSDRTANIAMARMILRNNIEMVENIARESDDEIGSYILKGVTEGRSFNNLKTYFEIPCERDMYYDRYHKFFWLLNKIRT